MDHDLVDTEVGRIAIACAAFDDVIGWLVLAAVARSGWNTVCGDRAGRRTRSVLFVMVSPCVVCWRG